MTPRTLTLLVYVLYASIALGLGVLFGAACLDTPDPRITAALIAVLGAVASFGVVRSAFEARDPKHNGWVGVAALSVAAEWIAGVVAGFVLGG